MAESAAGGEAAAAAAAVAPAPEAPQVAAPPAVLPNNNINNNDVRHLLDLASRPASHEHLTALAQYHPTTSSNNNNNNRSSNNWTSDTAQAYLRAVSQHLMGRAASNSSTTTNWIHNHGSVLMELLQVRNN